LLINVELSPYHAPQGVSGEYSPADGTFTIGFDYIDDEPPSEQKTKLNDVTISEGRFTGKILAITLPIDKPPLDKTCIIQVQTIGERVLDALRQRDRLVHERGKIDQELNQEAAKQILNENMNELLATR